MIYCAATTKLSEYKNEIEKMGLIETKLQDDFEAVCSLTLAKK